MGKPFTQISNFGDGKGNEEEWLDWIDWGDLDAGAGGSGSGSS